MSFKKLIVTAGCALVLMAMGCANASRTENEAVYNRANTSFDNALSSSPGSTEQSYSAQRWESVDSNDQVERLDADMTTTTKTTNVGDTPDSFTSMYNQGAPAGTEQADNRMVSNAAANEVKAYNFVEVTFEAGSTSLTQSAKTALYQVLSQAKRAGKLDEAIVMSWSDEEFPSKNLKKLPKFQRDLADNRNKSVKDYIKSIQKIDVDQYNMATQPNAFSKWFNTTDAKLKNSLIAAGLPTTADNPQYPSKASHSLILIKVE
jgi:hypothetical protein